MIPTDSIPFNGVGYLPAPSGHPAPQIYLCPYHPVFETGSKGAVAFRDEDDEFRKLDAEAKRNKDNAAFLDRKKAFFRREEGNATPLLDSLIF